MSEPRLSGREWATVVWKFTLAFSVLAFFPLLTIFAGMAWHAVAGSIFVSLLAIVLWAAAVSAARDRSVGT